MSTALPRSLLRIRYYEAAERISQPTPEHFMEAIPKQLSEKSRWKVSPLSGRAVRGAGLQRTARAVSLAAQKIGQVVPDNMVVIHPEPIVADGSYDVLFQPVGPFWMMEYVSNSNNGKDYEKSFKKYERDLKVPYYLCSIRTGKN